MSVQARRRRIEDLALMIRDNPGIPLLTLISHFAREKGSRRETVVDYLKLLKFSGDIKISNDRVYLGRNYLAPKVKEDT